MHTPVTTQFSFFNFITIANTEDIKKFLRLAATTTEGENLKYLWERAYEDGYENGRKSLLRNLEIKMEDKFEEGIEKGMSLGREEGYTVAKEGFDGIINAMRAREASKTTVTTESGIQTDPSTRGVHRAVTAHGRRYTVRCRQRLHRRRTVDKFLRSRRYGRWRKRP